MSLPSIFFPTISAAAAKSLQPCLTPCDPLDGNPPVSAIPGILQARTLEWVAISFSNAWKWKVKVKSLSRVRLFATPWTAAYQASPSMGFSRQEYWSGVPLSPHPTSSTLALFLQVPIHSLQQVEPFWRRKPISMDSSAWVLVALDPWNMNSNIINFRID